MSKKCTDDNNEQQKTNPNSALQNEVQAQHAQLTSPSTATTLQDLPLELHELILLEAIVSEIRDRKLFRCAWKESAHRVAERLRNVCPQWDYVLTTDSFRIRLHGIIDTFPSVQINMTDLVFRYFSTWCIDVDALDDEYFLLCHPPEKHAVIRICDRDDLHKPKSLIQLPEVTVPWNLVACSVSRCLYLSHKASDRIEILRVSREGEQFKVLPLITCSTQLVFRMCVSADGSLIVFQGPAPSTISTYNADGSLQRQIHLTKPLSFVRDIISKSNGNVIIVSGSLTEISRDGDVLYDYDIKADGGFRGHIYCAVDIYDKILTVDVGDSVKLLDSDFNQAEVKIDKPKRIRCWKNLYQLHYNRQRNEFMLFDCCHADADNADIFLPNRSLKVFNVTETIVQEENVQKDEDVQMNVDVLNEEDVQMNADQNDEGVQMNADVEHDDNVQMNADV